MKSKNTATASFCRIKRGRFFRDPRTPRRLYQKYSSTSGQVVAGPSLGTARTFCKRQVIPIIAGIVYN